MASGKRASGAMYSGVPQRVLQPDAAATSLLKPQSHSFSVGLDAPGSTCSRMLSSCGDDRRSRSAWLSDQYLSSVGAPVTETGWRLSGSRLFSWHGVKMQSRGGAAP